MLSLSQAVALRGSSPRGDRHGTVRDGVVAGDWRLFGADCGGGATKRDPQREKAARSDGSPMTQAVPARGIDGLEEDFARTEAIQFRGRSLPYVRALRYLREIVAGPDGVPAVAARLEQVWGRREFHIYFSRPFLLLAALRAEALASTDHPLARGFATENPDSLAVTRDAILASLTPERSGVWIMLSSRGVQTNEVSRAVVWKWPAELAGWGNRSRPVALVDVGASGGLNLIADRLPDCWNDGAGKPLRVASKVDVCMRVGFDLQPLDFRRDDDVAWARACIWAGAAQRVERFDRAVREWRCAEQFEVPPALHKLNATFVPARLPELLARVPAGGVLVLYQTALREYMASSQRLRYEEGVRQWLASTPPRRAVWLEAEATPERQAAFAIVAHVPNGAGGIQSMKIRYTNIHPETVHVRTKGANEFAQYFSSP